MKVFVYTYIYTILAKVNISSQPYVVCYLFFVSLVVICSMLLFKKKKI